MRYLFWLIALWPLVCCEECDFTVVCTVLAIASAASLYVVASIVHELRRLESHRPH